MTRLNASIHESNFVSDMTKKRRAAAHFALLFASLVILYLAKAYTTSTNKICQF